MPLPNTRPGASESLAGKRVVVTAYDLEQSEHRGIAVYTKGLIRCLREAGAEVWLLTEFDEQLQGGGLRRLPAAMRSVIHSARVLDALVQGGQGRTVNWLEKRVGVVRKLNHWLRQLDDAKEFLHRPRHYRRHDLRELRLSSLFDNPYLRHERLGYLQNVEGLLCARKIFFSTQVAALLKRQIPVRVDLRGFDAFITSCPLNIAALNVPVFVQTVHDVIPLEYAQTSDNMLGFSHRLQACLPARRLYVSRSTATKFAQRIPTKLPATQERIVVQPPSLRFPHWLTADPQRVSDLKPVTYLLREPALADKPNNGNLKPFRYFLFNSSVEARKNLLFLVQAYAESNLGSQGIQLCVTGKLKKDSYSRAVKEIVKHEPGIVLTGYIDESTKLDLYLNALALLSPSLVEGFGIPVLDAACLGMTTIASDCDSHLEIQALDDFAPHVLAINTLESRNWAAAMQATAGLNDHLASQAAEERKRRIQRYYAKASAINQRFQDDLCALLN